jgi:hypothetical protein
MIPDATAGEEGVINPKTRVKEISPVDPGSTADGLKRQPTHVGDLVGHPGWHSGCGRYVHPFGLDVVKDVVKGSAETAKMEKKNRHQTEVRSFSRLAMSMYFRRHVCVSNYNGLHMAT